MSRLEDEFVHVFVHRQPVRTERVTHSLLDPFSNAGGRPVRFAARSQLAVRVRRQLTLECTALLSVSLYPGRRVRTDLREPSPVCLRYLGPNHDRSLRKLDIIPLHFLKFTLRTNAGEKTEYEIRQKREIVFERVNKHCFDLIGRDCLDLLTFNFGKFKATDGILREVAFSNSEKENGPQVSHHWIAPPG